MADYAKFYTAGAYLHSPPDLTRVDMYTQAKQQIQEVELQDIKNRGLERLYRQLAKAIAMEKGFYQLFGSDVYDAKSWNRKFFGMAGSNEGKWSMSDTLYSKTIKAINHREIYSILRGAEKKQEDDFIYRSISDIRDIVGEQVSSGIVKNGIQLSPKTGNTFQVLLKDIIRGITGGVKISKVGVDNRTVQRFNSLITQLENDVKVQAWSRDGVSGPELTKAIEKWLDGSAGKQAMKTQRLAGGGNIRAVNAATEKVIGLLNASLLPTDFNYPALLRGSYQQEYLSEKKQYIEAVSNRFKGMITDATLDNLITAQVSSGALGEISIMISIEQFLEREHKDDRVMVKHIATDMTIRKRVGSTGQHPVDIRLIDNAKGQEVVYNLQLKNTFAQYARGKSAYGQPSLPGDIGLPTTTSMLSFFSDIGIREILDGRSTAIFQYQIANSSFRGDSDGMLTTVAELLNSVVEHYVKSATATALTQEIDQSGVLVDVMENHFIIRPSIGLVPISTFIQMQIDILSDKGGAFSEFRLYTGQSGLKATNAGIDAERMHKNKLVIASKAYRETNDDYNSYPQELITYGIAMGKRVLHAMPGPNVALSAQAFIDAINSITL